MKALIVKNGNAVSTSATTKFKQLINLPVILNSTEFIKQQENNNEDFCINSNVKNFCY